MEYDIYKFLSPRF